MSALTVIDASIPAGRVRLDGTLTIPEGAKGIVVFAHGSGSSRFSSRNQHVAHMMNDARLGTLLFDLLTLDEQRLDERTGHLRFDIDFLGDRLDAAIRWIVDQDVASGLGVGLFGASTGAAAALVAAARHQDVVQAVVSRGGRPDLAIHAFSRVHAPTLLIVGGNDHEVLALNRMALTRLTCKKELQVVNGATHLFEEPGTLDQAAHLAAAWFVEHLRGRMGKRAA
jgi:putative phosphoribosyl transferase